MNDGSEIESQRDESPMETAISAASASDDSTETERRMRQIAHRHGLGEDDPAWALVSLAIEAALAGRSATTAASAIDEAAARIPGQIRDGAAAAGKDMAQQLVGIAERIASASVAASKEVADGVSGEIRKERKALAETVKRRRQQIIDSWSAAAQHAAAEHLKVQARARVGVAAIIGGVLSVALLVGPVFGLWWAGKISPPGTKVVAVRGGVEVVSEARDAVLKSACPAGNVCVAFER